MDYFYITCQYTPVLNDSDLEVSFLCCATIDLDNPFTHVHSGYRLADAVTTVFVKGVPGEGAGDLPKMGPIYVDMVDIGGVPPPQFHPSPSSKVLSSVYIVP